MTHKEPIYTVTMPIGSYPNVILNITYSGGENENDLEYEFAEVSDANKFTEDQIEEVNDLLQCGHYEDVINYLHRQYAKSNINFTVN